MDEVKKLSLGEIQTIVKGMLAGKDSQSQIEVLMKLVLACIEAIVCMHGSYNPAIISHAEIVLYKAIAELKKGS